eukprot:TRINITY_DN9408_c0_g3_i1.p1 TRINITY_DN9408_c0_g3~~TRINITY_DN9408_c0_g3_i1.p1  ORF type:complete len:602 (-),score=91.97 TRINITY_DN9408_c0_g3_i1:151-1956(-)
MNMNSMCINSIFEFYKPNMSIPGSQITPSISDPENLQQKPLNERSAIVAEMIRKRRAKRNSKPPDSIPATEVDATFCISSAKEENMVPVYMQAGQQSFQWSGRKEISAKKLNVFERLILDAKKKENMKKPTEVKKENNIIEGKKNTSVAPQIENRLLAHQRDRQNWLAKERFKKQSRELSESRSNSRVSPKPEKPLSICPKKSNAALPKRFSSHEFNTAPQSINLLEQASKLASMLNNEKSGGNLVGMEQPKVPFENKSQSEFNHSSSKQSLPRNEFSNLHRSDSSKQSINLAKYNASLEAIAKEELKLGEDIAKAQSVMQMLEARKKSKTLPQATANPIKKHKQNSNTNAAISSSAYKENVHHKQNKRPVNQENLLVKRSANNFQSNFEEPAEGEPLSKHNFHDYHTKRQAVNKHFGKTQLFKDLTNRKASPNLNIASPQIYYESMEERIRRKNYSSSIPQATPQHPPKPKQSSLTCSKPHSSSNVSAYHSLRREGSVKGQLNVAARNSLWLQRRNEKVAKQMNEKVAMEVSGCTFSPSLDTRSRQYVLRSGLSDCKSVYGQITAARFSPEEIIEMRCSNSYSTIKKIQTRSRSRDISYS